MHRKSSVSSDSLNTTNQPKMKFVVALCMMAVAAMAAPEAPVFKYIPVLERTEKHDESGQFALRYVSADGTKFSEQGVLKLNPDGKDYALVKEGEWEHIAPNGQVFRTKYVADHLGFRATGDHLPKSVVA